MTKTEARLYKNKMLCKNRTFHSQNAQQDFMLCKALPRYTTEIRGLYEFL
jgi:hypothetical protein